MLRANPGNTTRRGVACLGTYITHGSIDSIPDQNMGMQLDTIVLIPGQNLGMRLVAIYAFMLHS